jgi:NAD(P)-dependent dehydrogenase (short-subunit alcohol dehydrogenase family)
MMAMTEAQSRGSASLAGKVAIVTGAAQGLGAAFATELARLGAAVVVGDIVSVAQTVATIELAGGRAAGAALDVTSPQSVAALMELAMERFGHIDILINNAAVSGALRLRPLTEISSEEWDKVLAVNTRGVFECMKAVVPIMTETGYGKIVNLASGTAIKGSPGLLHYVASKGAVISMTRAAARELGDSGIRVNAIAPGLTMSEGILSNPSWSDDVVRANLASRALKREALPADLLGTLVFLSSSASDFMTGQVLTVDGGSVMG